MSYAEFLLVVAAWCSVPSYNRMTPGEVELCRKQLIECVDHKQLSIVLNYKVLECCKKQKILN